MQDEEPEGSGVGSDRDSDMEFEQMLADAEEVPGTESSTKTEETNAETPAEPPVRRKAKTKIGNKSKKKKKTKTTSKFPDGEEGVQVESRPIACAFVNVSSICFNFDIVSHTALLPKYFKTKHNIAS